MIGSIRGVLLERFSEGEKGEVLIETGGIGYRVIVTPTTAVKIGEEGSFTAYGRFKSCRC